MGQRITLANEGKGAGARAPEAPVLSAPEAVSGDDDNVQSE